MSRPAFPLPPRAFAGVYRRVPAAAAFFWLRQGWELFLAAPGPWMTASLLFILVLALLQFALFGGLLAALLLPLLLAGFSCAAARLAREGECELSDFFRPLQQRSAPLFGLGALLALAWGGLGAFVDLLVNVPAPGEASPGAGIILRLALQLLLAAPLLPAIWQAPQLVHGDGMAPAAAVAASFSAGCANWSALALLLGLALPLALLAVFSAGIAYLVLLPVLAGSLYAAREDVFVG